MHFPVLCFGVAVFSRAYYFGACSPSNYPEHYYKALRGLQRHLAKVVRPAHPNIPVIINTCGWVKGQCCLKWLHRA